MQLTANQITERIVRGLVVEYAPEVVFPAAEVSREGLFRATLAHGVFCAHDTVLGVFRLRYWPFAELEFPAPRFFILR